MSVCDLFEQDVRRKANLQHQQGKKVSALRHIKSPAAAMQMVILNRYLDLLPSERAQKKAQYVNRTWMQMERNVA